MLRSDIIGLSSRIGRIVSDWRQNLAPPVPEPCEARNRRSENCVAATRADAGRRDLPVFVGGPIVDQVAALTKALQIAWPIVDRIMIEVCGVMIATFQFLIRHDPPPI